MKTIEKAEATSWLASRGLADFEGALLPSAFATRATYRIPGDSGKKTVIARELAHYLAAFDESLLWIDEFGVWPAAENMSLFDAYRLSIGEGRPLYERPGHVLTSADGDAAFSLLCLVLYFVWGAVLAPSSADLMVRISHDEWIGIYSQGSGGPGEGLQETLRRAVEDPSG